MSLLFQYKTLASETEDSQESGQTEEVDSGDASSQVTADTDVITGNDLSPHFEVLNDAHLLTGDEGGESSQENTSQSAQEATTLQDAQTDDSLLTVRAKLFYKKSEEFVELGVGTLKVESSGGQSVRLLLRNDTSIGNVLMNIKVTGSVPMTRNKNNVMIVCQANPPLVKDSDNTSAVTYLLRVKTVELAERLQTVVKDSCK